MKTTNLERIRVMQEAIAEADSGRPRQQVEIFGYVIEKVSSEPNKVNYNLHGHQVIYRLVRTANGKTLYALNSHGNICGIKGNYHFSDETGVLTCVY